MTTQELIQHICDCNINTTKTIAKLIKQCNLQNTQTTLNWADKLNEISVQF